VHGRHARIGHVRDQADAGGEEPRVLVRAGHVLGHLRREGPVHRRDVDADLLEQAAVHHRHHAAAAGLAIPGLALEAAGRAGIEVGRGLVLQAFEFGADLVAQAFEPCLGASLLGVEVQDVGVVIGAHAAELSRRAAARK
jgi:hypothetical protein